MRVLHIAMGSPEFDRACVDLGHEVRRIAWREVIGRKFYGNTHPFLQAKILEVSEEFKPNLVFVQTHQSEVISGSTYYALRDNGAFVVNWCGDVREPLPECYVRTASNVDVMAFSNMTDVELVREKGHQSEYLQIGYDPEIYHPGDGTQERSGVVFMANHYQGRFPNTELRKEVALRLMKEFPDDFTLYGSGWGMPGVFPVEANAEADIYRRSLVAINVDHFTRPYFASDRILRAQACGCLTISWQYEGASNEHPYVPTVDNIDLIVALIRNKEDRDAHLARLQTMHTQENHTWHSRIKTIEGWMS